MCFSAMRPRVRQAKQHLFPQIKSGLYVDIRSRTARQTHTMTTAENPLQPDYKKENPQRTAAKSQRRSQVCP